MTTHNTAWGSMQAAINRAKFAADRQRVLVKKRKAIFDLEAYRRAIEEDTALRAAGMLPSHGETRQRVKMHAVLRFRGGTRKKVTLPKLGQ